MRGANIRKTTVEEASYNPGTQDARRTSNELREVVFVDRPDPYPVESTIEAIDPKTGAPVVMEKPRWILRNDHDARSIALNAASVDFKRGLQLLEGSFGVRTLMDGLKSSTGSLLILATENRSNTVNVDPNVTERKLLLLDRKGFRVAESRTVTISETTLERMREETRIDHLTEKLSHKWRMWSNDLYRFVENGVTLDQVVDVLSVHLGSSLFRKGLFEQLSQEAFHRRLWVNEENPLTIQRKMTNEKTSGAHRSL